MKALIYFKIINLFTLLFCKERAREDELLIKDCKIELKAAIHRFHHIQSKVNDTVESIVATCDISQSEE